MHMSVVVISTSESSQVAWLVTEVIVVVYIDAKSVGMLMKFHIPLANNGGRVVVQFRFWASSNEVLFVFFFSSYLEK